MDDGINRGDVCIIVDVYNSVVGVMKMQNIVLREGLKPKYLAFRVSVLPLHYVGSLMSQLHPRLSVYATHCLRGHCRPLNLSPWNCKSLMA